LGKETKQNGFTAIIALRCLLLVGLAATGFLAPRNGSFRILQNYTLHHSSRLAATSLITGTATCQPSTSIFSERDTLGALNYDIGCGYSSTTLCTLLRFA
jgi:hypothetical protein